MQDPITFGLFIQLVDGMIDGINLLHKLYTAATEVFINLLHFTLLKQNIQFQSLSEHACESNGKNVWR